MNIPEIPAHIGSADDDGLNNVSNTVVHDHQCAERATGLLDKNSQGVIKPAIRLKKYRW
jgi:hypothetical protein